MKDKILKIIAEHPNNYLRMIRVTPELLFWIQSNTRHENLNIPLKEQIFLALNPEVSNRCNNNNLMKFKSFTSGYAVCGNSKTCACAKNAKLQSLLLANQNKDYTFIVDKRKQTNLVRYGTENTSAINEVKEKIKQTSLERYGVSNYNKLDTAKQHLSVKQKEVQASEDIKIKRKQTVLEKYGVDNVSKLPETRTKASETMILRHGYANPMHDLTIKEHISNCAKNYAKDNHASAMRLSINNSLATLNNIYERAGNNVSPNWDVDDISLWHGTGYHTTYSWICNTCNNPFLDNLYSGNVPTCPICNTKTRKAEVEIYQYIQSIYPGTIIRNTRFLTDETGSKRELDIFLPDLNIAIEHDGLYWHSERILGDPYYHFNKMKLCNDNNIRLISIFEDEWLFKQDIVKHRLASILGQTTRIYARKCNIREITSKESGEFLTTYHIQGTVGASVKLGLFHEDKLVAVMTFGKPRFNKKVEWELLRFASSTTIVGGASKLLSHFKKLKLPKSIISYSDLRWNTGNVYAAIGFELNHISPIGFYWVKGTQRLTRYQTQHHKLVEQGNDPTLTSTEIMRKNKYFKIYDCGQMVWIWRSA